MSAAGANFYKILSDAIKQAGVEHDAEARAEIYGRARKTVLARASSSDSTDATDLQRGMDEAVAAIEMRLSEAAGRSDLAALAKPLPGPSHSFGSAPGSDRGVTATVSGSRTSESSVMMSQGSTALAMALPEPSGDYVGRPETQVDDPVRKSDVAEVSSKSALVPEETNDNVEARGAAERFRANVFPLWQKLAPSPTSGGGSMPRPDDVEAVEPAREEVLVGTKNLAFERPKSAPETEMRSLDRNDDNDSTDDPLERVAADIAEGFRYIDEVSVADKLEEDADAIDLTEPDENLVRDVGELVSDKSETPDSSDEAVSKIGKWRKLAVLPAVARPKIRLPKPKLPKANLPKPRLPKVALPKFRIGSQTAIVGALALLIGGTAVYFGSNPAPVDSRFAAAATSAGLIPDNRALDSTGWVTTDLQIEPVEGSTWGAYRVSDNSDSRFGKLAAPLNDIESPNGFRITVRFQKSEQRLPHFASIRVTAPYTRRAYTSDAQLDLTTGEVRAAGQAALDDISVIDDGESWRLTLETRLEGEVLFSKPRLEIFPAAGSVFGTYSATTTGGVIVGDIVVQKL